MAVSNPLYGSSRPGTAEGVPATQGMPTALPPKVCLVKGRLRSSSESEAGSGGRPQRRQRAASPEISVGPLPSLGSLGSGFSGEC